MDAWMLGFEWKARWGMFARSSAVDKSALEQEPGSAEEGSGEIGYESVLFD